jgi:uncharacterized protein (TIGR02246 family)
MRTLPYMAFTISLLVAGMTAQPVWAGPAEDVRDRFEEWIRTFNSHDAERLSQLYDQDARLLSTGGNETPLDGRETIRVYFIPFTKRGDIVAFDHDDAVKVFDNIAVETGYYHFNIFPDGKPDVWVARYTFVFEKKNGSWMILHQHSSRVPNLTATATK